MNTNFLVIRTLAIFTLASAFFVSCDDDISEIGADALIGSELNIIEQSDFIITSGQMDITKPQTNNLDYYLLGDNDHGYGNTKYSILSQINSYSVLVQDSNIEVFDDEDDEDPSSTTEINHELTSASLVLPFKYALVTSDDDDYDEDNITYRIESIISGESLDIKVYQSNYELQTSNPNDLSGSAQKYYADGSDGINKFGEAITDTEIIPEFKYPLPKTGDNFAVSLFDEEGDEYSDEEVSHQFTAIRIPLPDISKEKILALITGDEDENEDGVNDIDLSIIDEENFTTDIFRGLYIETSTKGGVAEILDFSESFVNAGIQLTFLQTTISSDDEDNETEEVITTLQFSSSPINILEKEATIELPEITGDNQEEIILQSGLGRIGTINLFSEDGDSDEITSLEELHEDNILLNDAILRLTVNTTNEDFYDEENLDRLPKNIFIAELGDGDRLLDYDANFSSSDDDNESLKEGHLMSLVFPEDGDPYYEINITEHLSNILRQDDDDSDDSALANVTLALSVTENLNVVDTSDLFTQDDTLFLNQGSLLCFKTVPLCGSSFGDDTNIENVAKRPLLTIKYTSTEAK